MNLILTLIYGINLKDWNINYINKIAKTYSKIFRDITLLLQYLQSKELEDI